MGSKLLGGGSRRGELRPWRSCKMEWALHGHLSLLAVLAFNLTVGGSDVSQAELRAPVSGCNVCRESNESPKITEN